VNIKEKIKRIVKIKKEKKDCECASTKRGECEKRMCDIKS
jgi:hypothetical protein